MRTVSLFSGVGGLECEFGAELMCEIDADCRVVLRRRFPEARLHDDVETLDPIPGIDAVFGGWPCQDISVAGLRRGLAGARSGLLFQMIDFAAESGAGTIVAENVPNLLRLESGENFKLTLDSFEQSGFPYVSWRVLNARQFGLPHERRRVFIVASQDPEIAAALLRDIRFPAAEVIKSNPSVAAFYWTAGIQSINYSVGYSPTLKVGSALSIPSPPAVFYDGVTRVLSPREAIKLQGFPEEPFDGLPAKAIYRMMGNAVALPVGKFVARTLTCGEDVTRSGRLVPISPEESLFGDVKWPRRWPPAGIKMGHELYAYDDVADDIPLSTSLEDFVDMCSEERLSSRAARGLLNRLGRSGKPCPQPLRNALMALA